MKKLLTYILTGIGILLLVLLSFLISGVGLLSVWNFIVKVVSYVGNGSVVRGIIFTPFFIFGIVQIVRSFLLLGNKIQEEAEEGLFIFDLKKSDRIINFGGLYVLLTFICYLLVFFIIATPG